MRVRLVSWAQLLAVLMQLLKGQIYNAIHPFVIIKVSVV